MKTKKISYVEKIVENLFTDKDPYAIQYLSKVFLHFKMDFSALPVISKKEANAIKTPINLFAGGNDIMFPGKKMLKRAKKIFPSLGNTILLEKSKHVQNKKDNTLIESYILK